MYFFYFDESGSRDPRYGRQPGDHLYVLLAVGLFEGQWRKFDQAVSLLKLDLADWARRQGKGQFQLADCEIKSNWVRNQKERAKKSAFLSALDEADIERLMACYFQQLVERRAVVMSAVIDKRHLHDHVDHEILHKKAYEFLLERIEHYLAEYHPKHNALIVMDDTSKALNRAVAMKHAYFQRAGNQNMRFAHIVEYPFFTRSELSNGVQLADLLAYSVFRAFREEDLSYPYFARLLPAFYRRREGSALDGLKVWPEPSPLIELAREFWAAYKAKTLHPEGPGHDVGLG